MVRAPARAAGATPAAGGDPAALAAALRHERIHVFRAEDLRGHRLQREHVHDDHQLRELPLHIPSPRSGGPGRAPELDALQLLGHVARVRGHGHHRPAVRLQAGRGEVGSLEPERGVGHSHQRLLFRLQLRVRLGPHRLGVLRGDLPAAVPGPLHRRVRHGQLGGQLHHRPVHPDALGGDRVLDVLRLRPLLPRGRVLVGVVAGDERRPLGGSAGVVRRQGLVPEHRHSGQGGGVGPCGDWRRPKRQLRLGPQIRIAHRTTLVVTNR
mmetsp:Transcript_31212/g.94432  ORF Transcript_31212/g.94432 Transcript_31212/m.94432 type:complete len:267 (+) Transcript_31212:217-1017(+)